MFSFYVYCLTSRLNNEKIVTQSAAITGENCVESVNYIDVQAVISIVDADAFSENAVKENFKNLYWVKEKAIIHENIIEEIMENAPVLPMRFCTIFNNIENLTGFLRKYYKQIKDFLSIAEKSCEWGIKVFCDRGKFKKSIMEMSDIKAEIDTISQKPKGISFMLMKKFEIKLDDYILNTINRDVQCIFDQIRSMAENTIVREIQSKDSEEIEIVLNMISLVYNSVRRHFSDRISNLENEYGCKGYTIKCTGPWPIYNFISFDDEDIRTI